MTDWERSALTSLADRGRSAPPVARRSGIMLGSADGQPTAGIAKGLHGFSTTVWKWRTRFPAHRIEGVADERRPGTPRRITDARVGDVVVRTLEWTARGATHRSTRAMARASGPSQPAIGRVGRAFGLRPHRTETFWLWRDLWLVEKVWDIVGVYVNPPEHAGLLRLCRARVRRCGR